jgi:glycosyltransferase involved in cell wall biosynthesis
MKQRLDHDRLTFYMSERWWKPPIGIGRLLYPPFASAVISFRKLAKSLYMHFLPIGDYSTQDMSPIAPFTNRMWRWGYFPAVPNPLPACERKEQGLHVLWAGRLLKWKRVDTLIKAFSRLSFERPDSFLTLVGEGNEQKRIEKLAENLLAPRSYQVLAPMPVSQVLQLMRQHHVYVLSSNGYEGWGAVVNEAMAEGCAVIASETTGAGKTMIRHGKNGLLFPARDWKKLGELLCIAGSDESQRIRLAQEGQRTIADIWSPAVAAKRFFAVCDAFLSKQTPPIFSDGPMQPAWK